MHGSHWPSCWWSPPVATTSGPSGRQSCRMRRPSSPPAVSRGSPAALPTSALTVVAASSAVASPPVRPVRSAVLAATAHAADVAASANRVAAATAARRRAPSASRARVTPAAAWTGRAARAPVRAWRDRPPVAPLLRTSRRSFAAGVALPGRSAARTTPAPPAPAVYRANACPRATRVEARTEPAWREGARGVVASVRPAVPAEPARNRGPPASASSAYPAAASASRVAGPATPNVLASRALAVPIRSSAKRAGDQGSRAVLDRSAPAVAAAFPARASSREISAGRARGQPAARRAPPTTASAPTAAAPAAAVPASLAVRCR